MTRDDQTAAEVGTALGETIADPARLAAPSALVGGDVGGAVARTAIGIDVGGTKVLGIAIDGAGTVVAEERRQTVNNGEALLDDLAGLCGQLMATAAPTGEGNGGRANLVSVGVGVPGLVDREGVLEIRTEPAWGQRHSRKEGSRDSPRRPGDGAGRQ